MAVCLQFPWPADQVTADCMDDIIPQSPLLERKDQQGVLEGDTKGAPIKDIITALADGGTLVFDKEVTLRSKLRIAWPLIKRMGWSKA